jgi:mRNA interferase RelE/StbE
MSLYRVKYTPRVDRDLEKLFLPIARTVIRAIGEISDAPYSSIKKLKGSNPRHPVYSLRIGRNIRVLLSIHDNVLIIHVLEIEDRKQSLRDF